MYYDLFFVFWELWTATQESVIPYNTYVSILEFVNDSFVEIMIDCAWQLLSSLTHFVVSGLKTDSRKSPIRLHSVAYHIEKNNEFGTIISGAILRSLTKVTIRRTYISYEIEVCLNQSHNWAACVDPIESKIIGKLLNQLAWRG